MLDVATDVRSTFLLLRAKKHIYADDQDFHIVQAALSQLSGNLNKRQLQTITTDPPRTAKTVRRYFKERTFATVSFTVPNAPDQATSAQEQKDDRVKYDHSHEWRKYYVKLLVLAQARRWLSSTEQLQPVADAPPTPKTNFQLADTQRKQSMYLLALTSKMLTHTALSSPDFSRMQRSTTTASMAITE